MLLSFFRNRASRDWRLTSVACFLTPREGSSPKELSRGQSVPRSFGQGGPCSVVCAPCEAFRAQKSRILRSMQERKHHTSYNRTIRSAGGGVHPEGSESVSPCRPVSSTLRVSVVHIHRPRQMLRNPGWEVVAHDCSIAYSQLKGPLAETPQASKLTPPGNLHLIHHQQSHTCVDEAGCQTIAVSQQVDV